ncbi:hypothetical protein M9Y10_040116 [Tritrichomonas musculus]|uniref:Uncharacterized protein n=1 Tax=Tritrichomonas musculus TaxID=1915356 RepID=A0ABR2GQW6_9EUKA
MTKYINEINFGIWDKDDVIKYMIKLNTQLDANIIITDNHLSNKLALCRYLNKNNAYQRIYGDNFMYKIEKSDIDFFIEDCLKERNKINKIARPGWLRAASSINYIDRCRLQPGQDG